MRWTRYGRVLRSPGLTCAVALALLGCSDDDTLDGGSSLGDATADRAAAGDYKGSKLPPGYKPYKCSKPGKACNPHDPCAINAVCGKDLKCWPAFLMNCDDGLSCTDDFCMGKGLCENRPKAGFCALGFTQPANDAGVPSTIFKCVTTGTKKPNDPCLACNPTIHDGGVTGNTKWMPISGGKCDDKNACSRDDTCVNGTCKGTYYGNQCADSLGCTLDLCDGTGGCLGNKLKSDYCLINGECYKDGAKHPSGGCYQCKAKVSQSSWTAITNSCLINGKCYDKGDKHSGKCAECDPGVSTSAWTVKGDACLINNICKKPADKDPTGCTTCDPKTDKYGWSAIAGLCKIYGKCYKKGDKHSGGCAECDAAINASGWTVKGKDCLINNVCKKPGDKDSIQCATCDPTKSKYSWTAIAGLCKIGGSCHKTGATHPGKCATCDPSTSATSWTVKGTKHCLIFNICKQAGDKNLSGCGSCNPGKNKNGWSALPGLCQIDGKCYSSGAKHTGGCGVCDPSNSTKAWTPAGSGCVIDSTCHASGAKHPAGCGSCEPSKSKTDWTVSGNSCAIGNKCYGNGTKEPGGCGTCMPAKSKTSWTKSAGCVAAHAWSRRFGGSSSDITYGMAVDGNGNVYITGYFYNTVNFGGSNLSSKGSADVFLASFTPSGKHRWSKSFGGSSSDYGYGVALDGNGNVYLTGAFYNTINFGGSTFTSTKYYDVFVASFDSGGKHRWSRAFGGTNYDYGYSIAADSAGNVYVTGYFYYNINCGGSTLTSKGSYDVFVAAYDSNGKHRWSKNFGNTSSDYGYGVNTDGSGNVYLTGYFYNSINFGGLTLTSNGSGDIFLASLSSTGAHRWSKSFGGSSSDYGYAVATDASGNVYITGYFYNSGDFGGGTLTSNGYGDIFVASYTSGGTHRWSKAFGGSSSDYGYGIDADAKGNVYVTGYFYNSVNFGGGTLSGKYDIFVASLTSGGMHRWSRSHGNTSSDYGRAIGVDAAGNTYVSGYFYNSVDFGGGPLQAISTDIFLLKLSP